MLKFTRVLVAGSQKLTWTLAHPSKLIEADKSCLKQTQSNQFQESFCPGLKLNLGELFSGVMQSQAFVHCHQP